MTLFQRTDGTMLREDELCEMVALDAMHFAHWIVAEIYDVPADQVGPIVTRVRAVLGREARDGR